MNLIVVEDDTARFNKNSAIRNPKSAFGSPMSDQADHLRELVRQAVQARPVLSPGLPLVVLSGGASGAGVSTLAIQLARELARIGKPALLVDANLARPQLAEQIGVAPQGSLADVLNGSRSAIEVVEPVGEGVHLLPAQHCSDAPPELNRTALGRLLAELRGLGSIAEVGIVDAGHGMSPWVERWWRTAQQVFLITTGADAALKGSYLAVKLAPWGDADGKVRLVVNQCDQRTTAESITERFTRTCRQFLGLHVEGAPAIACRCEPRGTHDAFRQSVRLLATEVVSSGLVVSGRLAGRCTKRGGRVAELLALPQFLPNSTNITQSAEHE